MGGKLQKSLKSSTRVVLEAAVFNGKSIRKTSGRLNLRLNHLLALKKASMWQPLMKPLMRQLA